MRDLVKYLTDKAAALPEGARFMVGIVGCPGAGKSMFSEKLVNAINCNYAGLAIVVPMDGFHLPNALLEERGLRHLKGVPETFDAGGFVDLLGRLRKMPARSVECPAFDRSVDEPTPDAIQVEPHHRVLVVEGNYLLLKDDPWHRVGELLDEVWYIDSSTDKIRPRLLERHLQGGRTPEAAAEKVQSTDLPNARLIEATRKYANRVISVESLTLVFNV